MSNEDSQSRERDAGKRVASLIQSIGQAPGKQVTSEERGRLKAAAGRLDRMLKTAGDSERQALRDAAGRLDRLLGEMRKGKDVSDRIKRRDG